MEGEPYMDSEEGTVEDGLSEAIKKTQSHPPSLCFSSSSQSKKKKTVFITY